MKTFEDQLHIWTIAEVIAFYQKAYPDMEIIKIKLSYKGQFLRYEIKGQDLTMRQTLQLNAQTGGVLKEKSKFLSPIECADQDSKAIDLENLLTLNDVYKSIKSSHPTFSPYRSRLMLENGQTIYSIDIYDETNEVKAMVKLDAHDGTVLNSIFKPK